MLSSYQIPAFQTPKMPRKKIFYIVVSVSLGRKTSNFKFKSFFFFRFTGRYIVLDKVPGLEVTESGLESRCRMGQFNKFCRAQNCQYFD